jgi:hypothetical protein
MPFGSSATLADSGDYQINACRVNIGYLRDKGLAKTSQTAIILVSMRNEQQTSENRLLRKIALLSAVLSLAAGTVVLVAGFVLRGGSGMDLIWAGATMLILAGLTVFLHRFSLTSWQISTQIGYIIGLVSAIQLLSVPNVIGGYRISVLTIITFAGHGVILGMFLEFIMWAHRITHGMLDNMIKGGLNRPNESKDNEKIRLQQNRE